MDKDTVKLLEIMNVFAEEYEQDTSPEPTRGEQVKTDPNGQGIESGDLNENPTLSYEELTSKETKVLIDMDGMEKAIRFMRLTDKLKSAEALAEKYIAGCGKQGCWANLTVGTTGPNNGAKDQDWGSPIIKEKPECGSSSSRSTKKVSDEAGRKVEPEKSVEQELVTPTKKKAQKQGGSVIKNKGAKTRSSAKQEEPSSQEWVKPTKKKAQNQGGSTTKNKGAKTRSSAKQEEPLSQEWVPIGSGITLISPEKYKKYKTMKSYTRATRILLMALFSRSVLATHTLTGKPSPAFPDKPSKRRLDQQKISDVIEEITKKFEVTKSLVRNAITIKCADENKMSRARSKKNLN